MYIYTHNIFISLVHYEESFCFTVWSQSLLWRFRYQKITIVKQDGQQGFSLLLLFL